jgi:TonB family protein
MARQTQLSSLDRSRYPEYSADLEPSNPSQSQPASGINLGSSLSSFQSLLNRTVVEVLEGTGASAVAVALAEGANGMACRASVGANSPGLGTRVDVESGLSGECVRSGSTMRCDNAESDPRVNSAACQRLGIRSIVATPIQVDSEVVGIIEAFSDKADAFGQQDAKTLEHAARKIAEASGQRSSATPPPKIEPETIADTTPEAAREAPSIATPQTAARPPIRTTRSIPPHVAFAVSVILLLAIGVWSLWPRGPRRSSILRPSHQPVAIPAKAEPPATASTSESPGEAPKVMSSGRNKVSKQSALTVKAKQSLGDLRPQVGRVASGTQSNTQTLPVSDVPPPSLIFSSNAGAVPPPVIRNIVEPSTAKLQGPRMSTGIEEGKLIRRIEPRYPNLALSSHIQGTVVLEATITRDGSVSGVRPITGNALLMNSAVNAVKQWRYTPYKLNGQPLDVQTRITLNFALP